MLKIDWKICKQYFRG